MTLNYIVGTVNPRIGEIYQFNLFKSLDDALELIAEIELCPERDYELMPIDSDQVGVYEEFTEAF